MVSPTIGTVYSWSFFFPVTSVDGWCNDWSINGDDKHLEVLKIRPFELMSWTMSMYQWGFARLAGKEHSTWIGYQVRLAGCFIPFGPTDTFMVRVRQNCESHSQNTPIQWVNVAYRLFSCVFLLIGWQYVFWYLDYYCVLTREFVGFKNLVFRVQFQWIRRKIFT